MKPGTWDLSRRCTAPNGMFVPVDEFVRFQATPRDQYPRTMFFGGAEITSVRAFALEHAAIAFVGTGHHEWVALNLKIAPPPRPLWLELFELALTHSRRSLSTLARAFPYRDELHPNTFRAADGFVFRISPTPDLAAALLSPIIFERNAA